MTEEEEDEEYLKEEEDAFAGSGGTRLLMQPSCEPCLVANYDAIIIDFISIDPPCANNSLIGRARNQGPHVVTLEFVQLFLYGGNPVRILKSNTGLVRKNHGDEVHVETEVR